MREPTPPDPYRLLSEYADQVHVSNATMRRWVLRGELPAARLGKQLLIRQSDFDAFIAERMIKAEA